MSDMQLNSNDIDSSNNNNSLYEFSQIIQNFNKISIKEIEPTTKNVKKYNYEDFGMVIDELVNLNFKELNEGKEENARKQHILDCINNYEINLQEIYNWILSNQSNSNSIYLLGFFNFHGIETCSNRRRAFELFQKAANLGNNVAQLDLAYMCIYKKGFTENLNIAFELLKNLAEKGFPSAMNMLGYCYEYGVGTDVNKQKAFELYQKAANLGNSDAQY